MKQMPTELIQDIKLVYPDWKELHQACDSNANIVGRYLDDASSHNIAPQVIVLMIDNNGVEQLRKDAQLIVDRKKLYVKWLSWYRSNHELKHS